VNGAAQQLGGRPGQQGRIGRRDLQITAVAVEDDHHVGHGGEQRPELGLGGGQRLDGLDALGDVAIVEDEGADGGFAQQVADGRLYPAPGAVLVADTILHGGRGARIWDQLLEQALDTRQVVEMNFG
jgi:hypothetical protein